MNAAERVFERTLEEWHQVAERAPTEPIHVCDELRLVRHEGFVVNLY